MAMKFKLSYTMCGILQQEEIESTTFIIDKNVVSFYDKRATKYGEQIREVLHVCSEFIRVEPLTPEYEFINH